MIVSNIIRAAQNQVIVNHVIIWNPNISKVLFIGNKTNIPKTLMNKEIKSYRYHKEKERMIIRI